MQGVDIYLAKSERPAKIIPDDEPGWSEFRVHDDGQDAVPLFVVDGPRLLVVTLDAPCHAVAGQSVISLVSNPRPVTPDG